MYPSLNDLASTRVGTLEAPLPEMSTHAGRRRQYLYRIRCLKHTYAGHRRKRKALPRLLDRACKKFLAITYSRPEGLPSAGTGLASVFGMGTGVSPPVKSPGNSLEPGPVEI